MRILLSVLLLLLFVPSWSGDERLALLPAKAEMAAHPMALDWRDPARVKLGGLTFLGGVYLTGPKPAFGGFSAMTVEGDRFTLLSDGGNIVSFRMGRDWQARAPRFAELPDGPGRGWHKSERDSESLTRDPATGQLWVGFERANQIWRYAPGFARAEAHAAPPAMAEWPDNGGAEAMARLRDGSFIVLSESEDGDAKGTRRGLWFAGDPVRAPRRGFAFSYRPPKGFKPTDIAELPDGRLVVLNRKASLREMFTAVVAIVDRGAVGAGRIATGREIARFAAPVVHDNFEAVAVTREGRDTILWIASDDNQWRLQRSLLLKFRLDV
ncbi:esterase-like activity of phytase family protein [Sphingomonas sp. BT-65]|uniref:esterase-like activity of phytase family protein n=1 Tax=Sphingomonas sp. BT-65 TaxID=2989821 RepID=UPI002235E012|nr:esterase-like activity of phytase family protein [Sphingomonas sp. BT-65]MCW4461725.1 esterase-like activity of phytase family protein [Sphingomonas sp. BT-65]